MRDGEVCARGVVKARFLKKSGGSVPLDELAALFGLDPSEAPTLYHAGGCAECHQQGYRGRTGIYELVVFDEHLRTLIHSAASEQEMTRHARSLGPSIREDGRRKVLEGVTTVAEVLRVTREE